MDLQNEEKEAFISEMFREQILNIQLNQNRKYLK